MATFSTTVMFHSVSYNLCSEKNTNDKFVSITNMPTFHDKHAKCKAIQKIIIHPIAMLLLMTCH